MSRTKCTGFTLIELLVVVAIIALLISILLPSLSQARDQARAVKCGVQLHSLGVSGITYAAQENDYFPGVNTSGANFELALALASDDLPVLRSGASPTQSFDWITPGLRLNLDMGANRARRFQTLLTRYTCPSLDGYRVESLYKLNECADKADFDPKLEWTPPSYLMPGNFQYWGTGDAGTIATGISETGLIRTVSAKTVPSFFSVTVHKFRSRIGSVGDPARKIMAADGTRFVDIDQFDYDVRPVPNPPYFGSFASSGAWWCGDTSYGVKSGSVNWDGQVVSAGLDNPEGQGRALTLTYRHSRPSSDEPVTCQANRGTINAMFFDGHISRMNDRESREIVYWYPKGSIVQNSSEGMTNVPQGWEIP